MRTRLIAAALLAAVLFSGGYAIGQLRGTTGTFAATGSATPTPTTPQGSTRGPFGGRLSTHADGTVTAVNGNTITVQPDADTGNPDEYASVTTIKLTSGTQYGGPGGSTGTSSVAVGSYILAWGTVSADGKTLTASQVSVLPSGSGNGGGSGSPSSGTGSGTSA